MVDESWVLARAVFEPCYIGGWSAAEHWGFTEQIFNSTMVFTTVGGIRMAVDILSRYLKSKYKNTDLLFRYSKQMKNTAIFKRLGFTFERFHPEEKVFIQ